LAIEVKATAILLDDDPARKLATELGLRVIGTADVLIFAKERQLIPGGTHLLYATLYANRLQPQELR